MSHHVHVMCYQTGSGKTYTMEGPSCPDEESEGMIPRALRQVFAAAQDLSDKGWVVGFLSYYTNTYNVHVHVQCIYNV